MRISIILIIFIYNVPTWSLTYILSKEFVKKNLKVNNLVVIDKHFVLVFSCEFVWENNQNFSFLTEVILRN